MLYLSTLTFCSEGAAPPGAFARARLLPSEAKKGPQKQLTVMHFTQFP